jgi:hypothetical protein
MAKIADVTYKVNIGISTESQRLQVETNKNAGLFMTSSHGIDRD